MPGAVAVASVPTSGGNPIVMPLSLSSAFTRTFTWPTLSNEYRDGTVQNLALTTTSHKSWSMRKRLRMVDDTYTDLFAFWNDYPNQPFYFYDPYEVGIGDSPGDNYDPTGASSVGRYKVVFVGGWSQVNNLSHIEVSLNLVEVV